MGIIGSRSYLSGLEDEVSAPRVEEESSEPAQEAGLPQPDAPQQESKETGEAKWRDIDIFDELDHNSVG